MSAPAPETLQGILQRGDIMLKGRFMLGSNYTFLVSVRRRETDCQAVYKPSRGEQPLWDFPDNTLAQREVAAYLISQALGWNFVPLTVLRQDGPLGPGSLQQFVEYDPNEHYFSFKDLDKERLRPVALFDLLINNADRKGSHMLIEIGTNRIWLIDHGLSFHVEDKLRTVIWDFAGEDIPPELLSALENLRAALSRVSDLHAALQPYLSPEEIAALAARADRILEARVFPYPPEDRRAYPYPPL